MRRRGGFSDDGGDLSRPHSFSDPKSRACRRGADKISQSGTSGSCRQSRGGAKVTARSPSFLSADQTSSWANKGKAHYEDGEGHGRRSRSASEGPTFVFVLWGSSQRLGGKPVLSQSAHERAGGVEVQTDSEMERWRPKYFALVGPESSILETQTLQLYQREQRNN